ncbi:D-ribose pyranase [Alicyclobacillus fastidiosus]|uniref:D-ribose pyranase n=1 Tax=Alicyclobacillus fastidiosus TaxID=392011 RepID=A0ABV5AI88_9BACL|nr:D-ribose pyranase [Alicyclobacillus fastidiosus]WEH07964.1 D-ribose pyranase [Alicyclobacillus fastidiosus]
MKKNGVLHSELSKIIAELGHGQALVVADYGLPVPKGVRMIDLAIRENVPAFMDVFRAILTELTVEKAVVASELKDINPSLYTTIETNVEMPLEQVPHETLKQITENVSVVVRTGEWTPYANVVLYAGVVF